MKLKSQQKRNHGHCVPQPKEKSHCLVCYQHTVHKSTFMIIWSADGRVNLHINAPLTTGDCCHLLKMFSSLFNVKYQDIKRTLTSDVLRYYIEQGYFFLIFCVIF